MTTGNEFDDEQPTVLIRPETMAEMARKYEAQWDDETISPNVEVDELDKSELEFDVPLYPEDDQ